MGLDHWCRLALGMAAVARPAVCRRIADDPGAHRVELDRALAGVQIALVREQAGPEASFTERAAVPTAAVDGSNRSLAERLHQPSRTGIVGGRNPEMEVIGHQHIGMVLVRVRPRVVVAARQVRVTALVTEEARLPVVAPLDQLQGDARQCEARTAGRRAIGPRARTKRNQRIVVCPLFLRVSIFPSRPEKALPSSIV